MNRILQFLVFIFWGTLLYSQNIVVDGVTFSVDGQMLIKYPKDKVAEEYIVPEGTEIIVERAFESNSYLGTITLPFSLNKIEDYAFLGLVSLSSVTWKHFPESIGEQLFLGSNVSIFHTLENSDNCISMDGVLFSKDQKVLYRFPNKKNSFEKIYEIPEGTEVIFNRAFENSEIYERVTLPSSLKLIEDEAFAIRERSTTRQYNRSNQYWVWDVVCNALTPPTVIGDPFINHYRVSLFVPEKNFYLYRNTPFWQDFYSINGDTGIEQNQVDSLYIRVYVEKKQLRLESERVIGRIEIYNTNGTCIWSECVGNETWQLDTFRLPMNLLLIKVITTDGKQETFKLLNRDTI